MLFSICLRSQILKYKEASEMLSVETLLLQSAIKEGRSTRDRQGVSVAVVKVVSSYAYKTK